MLMSQFQMTSLEVKKFLLFKIWSSLMVSINDWLLLWAPICYMTWIEAGEQGWHSGEMWPRFNSSMLPCVRQGCCWFSPCSEGFSLGSPFYLPPQKPTSPKMTRIENPHVNQLRMMMASSLKFVISLFMTVAELNGCPIEFVNFFIRYPYHSCFNYVHFRCMSESHIAVFLLLWRRILVIKRFSQKQK